MSERKDNKSKRSHVDEVELQSLIYRFLCATGRIVPQTEDDVAHAEATVDEDRVELPQSLLRPPVRPPSHDVAKATGLPMGSLTPMGENLARAARSGKDIPPEVLRRMKKDRERAERESGLDE